MLNTILRPIRQKVETASRMLFVAASDANQETREGYDYLCDGVNDEAEINHALEVLSRGGGRITTYFDWRWRWPREPAIVYEKGLSTGWLSNGSFMCSDEYVEVPNGVRLEGQGMSNIYGGVRTLGSGTVKALCVASRGDVPSGTVMLGKLGNKRIKIKEENMDSKDALVKLVSDRIDASIEELRAELEDRLIKMVPEAESRLKSAGEVLKTELQAVAEFPADFVTFFLEKRPRLWQSNRAIINKPDISFGVAGRMGERTIQSRTRCLSVHHYSRAVRETREGRV